MAIVPMKNIAALDSCQKLYLNEEFADVHFVFKFDGEVQKVPANKLKLAVLSPVFKTMFYGSLKEGNEVQIEDADADAFKEFLQFFYLGQVKLTMENIETVVRLADKYDVLEYVEACAKFLRPELTNESMMWGYQLAVNLKNENLIKFCEKQIILRPKDVFASEAFMRCDKSSLERILDLGLICDEVDVFDACLTWAKHACKADGLDDTQGANLRTQLGDCLNTIRFGSMTVEEFNERYLLHDDLFTLKEFRDVMLTLTSKGYESKIFKQTQRRGTQTWDADNALRCERILNRNYGRIVIRDLEVVSFSSNRHVFLGEFHTSACFSVSHSNENIPITITEQEGHMFDPSVPIKVLYESTTSPDQNQMKITLPHPILIRPGCMYEISLGLQSFSGVYHQNNKTSVEIASGIDIYFHRNPALNYDNAHIGWISTLFFNDF